MLTGVDSIEDVGVLPHGEMPRLFDGGGMEVAGGEVLLLHRGLERRRG